MREDLFDVASDTENLQVSLLSEGEDSAVDYLDISVKDIIEQQKSEWMLLKEQYKITIIITPLDEAPSDWFESGISILVQEEKPWYLTAEDLYKCTKDLMVKLTGQVSVIPSAYLEDILEKLDFVTSKVAEKLLHIQLEEGFSFVAKIDELLEKVLSSTDEHVDQYRLQLALRLQQLRKSVTLHLQELSQTLASKTDMYRAQVEGVVTMAGEKKKAVDQSVATAYTWAADTSASTLHTARAEHTAIVNKIDALRLSGKEVLEQTQSRVIKTRDQVVNSVQTKLTAADDALRVQLPAVAHPYILQAVDVSTPYVETAVSAATPYLQTVRDQDSVKKLESWVMDKKKDELMTLLDKNKHTPAGSMVSALLSQASRVITEVSDYCLNDDYFERNQQQEETVQGVQEEEGEVKLEEEVPATMDAPVAEVVTA